MDTSQTADTASLNTKLTTLAYAEVLIDLQVDALEQRLFTYRIPEDLQAQIQVGSPVLVPFGGIAEAVGYVIALHEKPPVVAGGHQPVTYKGIEDLLSDTPVFDTDYLALLQWTASYYAASLIQVLATAIPAQLLQKRTRLLQLKREAPQTHLAFLALSPIEQRILETLNTQGKPLALNRLSHLIKQPPSQVRKVLPRLLRADWLMWTMAHQGEMAAKQVTALQLADSTRSDYLDEGLTAKQEAILAYFIAQQQTQADATTPLLIPQQALLETLKVSMAPVQKLLERGLLLKTETVSHRDPLKTYQTRSDTHAIALNERQRACTDQIWVKRHEAAFIERSFLLYGVTGSGKTQVYLELTQRTLAEGRSVLMLVPEIALTSHIAKRFMAHFGRENIALWHSNLSLGERRDTWHRVRSGELRILIGARSGIFCPMPNIGLILIDEAHDGSFKQDSPAPRYDAKRLATYLAERSNAMMVLGSATPEVRDYHDAVAVDQVLTLEERYGGRPLAEVMVVNMRDERADGVKGLFSRGLLQALRETVEQGQQAIVLMNRRGFFTVVSCLTCDYQFLCPHCSVSLTVHHYRKHVRCHYCGYEETIPQFCPNCAATELIQSGVGTQRVEEELRQCLPEARILRIDSDTIQRKNAYRELIEHFAEGEADILVGTQMIAKGLDIPSVTLVGVLQADATFQLPDYRAAERGFQLLTQVAGRAGRGEFPGKVFFQTNQPNHPVIQYAMAQEYTHFYSYEIENRQLYDFPPFCQLFRLIVSGENERQTKDFILAVVAHLRDRLQRETEALELPVFSILGPSACVIARIQGRYRFHALVKNPLNHPHHQGGHEWLTAFYRQINPPEGIHCLLDIDPNTLL